MSTQLTRPREESTFATFNNSALSPKVIYDQNVYKVYKLQVVSYNYKMSVVMVNLLYCTNYTNMSGTSHDLR
jgi:hypothetical protein